MMRRIVTNLILARLVPMGIKAAQTAFRKRKSAQAQGKPQADNLDAPSNDAPIGDVTETAQRDVTDKATR